MWPESSLWPSERLVSEDSAKRPAGSGPLKWFSFTYPQKEGGGGMSAHASQFSLSLSLSL